MSLMAPERHQNFESLTNKRISSKETEIRIIDSRNGPVRQDGLPESIEIWSIEMNASFPGKIGEHIVNVDQWGH